MKGAYAKPPAPPQGVEPRYFNPTPDQGPSTDLMAAPAGEYWSDGDPYVYTIAPSGFVTAKRMNGGEPQRLEGAPASAVREQVRSGQLKPTRSPDDGWAKPMVPKQEPVGDRTTSEIAADSIRKVLAREGS